MKREDLRSKIIPTTIENTDEHQNKGNKDFNTTDLIYLESYEEQYDGKKTDMERRISATDYAQMNNAYIYNNYTTRNGRQTTWAWSRSAYDKYNVYYVYCNGEWNNLCANSKSAGLCPSLHYHLPSDISLQGKSKLLKNQENGSQEPEQFDIREVKDTDGKIIYYTLQIGEYAKTKVDEDLSKTLESLYNGGKIQEGILCTGRWYSGNGQKEGYKDYAGKHSPEFEYKGERYVRVVSYPNSKENRYSDGVPSGKNGTIRWVKVEPISFVIKNWDEMPKSINPIGNGRARYFDLRSEEAIISNIPFYPDEDDQNSTMWQNSSIRGFFNGIDVRNIQSNGNREYGASRGGNFAGECNFLNEAFNLSREPIIEYTIPDSETEIPDDAFNGCITLKKLVVHSRVKSIGKKAFDGLNFKHVYRTKTGELVFSQEMLEHEETVEIDKIAKCFDGFEYNILVQSGKLEEVIDFSETLRKNNFRLPYIYALELVKSGKVKSFCENSDFRFFKNEIPKINDMLSDFPEEEKLDFFKFAGALGCFSEEKILDKKGKETQVTLAQKASSLLARLLKTDEMKLRQISRTV